LLTQSIQLDIMKKSKIITINGPTMLSKIMKIVLLTSCLTLQACTTCDIANIFGNDICNIAALDPVSNSFKLS